MTKYQKYRANKIAQGICISCRLPAQKGNKLCMNHLKMYRKWGRHGCSNLKRSWKGRNGKSKTD